MKATTCILLLPFLAALCTRAEEPMESDSSWHISIGPQWRELGHLDMHTGSMAAQTILPWLAGKGAGNSMTPAIPLGQGSHNYDDGFVREDSSGGAFGDTWYWGYNNASQVQGTNLVFHSATGGGSTTATTFDSNFSLNHPSWSQTLSGPGWFTEIETPALLKLGPVRVSAFIGYSFAQADTGHSTSAVFGGEQQTHSNSQSTSVQDTYDASGIVIPPAPYAGTFNGPGPLIADTPTSRLLGTGPSSSSGTSAFFRDNVTESMVMDLHTISLGPNLSVHCCSRLRLGLGFGLGLNVANWEAHYDEKLYGNSSSLGHFHRDASGTSVLPGFFLEPSAEFALGPHVGIFVSSRYDWSEAMHGEVGPSTFKFSPGGWSVQSGLRVTF